VQEIFGKSRIFFELSNHLGNVLVTVSDKHLGVDSDNDGIINYYNADVVTANDYYPFGMQMPGRKFTSNSGYRYGFNGQEKSTEIAEGLTTAEFWQYDSRVAKRWNVDPKQKIHESPYFVFSGNPILLSDLKGDCPERPGKSNGLGEVESVSSQGVGGGALIDREKELNKHAYDGPMRFTGSVLKALGEIAGALTQVPAQMHYGDRIKTEEGKKAAFPSIYNLTYKDVLASPFTVPANAIQNIMNNPYDEAVWGENLVYLAPLAKPFLKVSGSIVALDQVVENVASVQAYAKAAQILSTSPKSALPRAVSAVYDKLTGQTYYGSSGALSESTILHPDLKMRLPSETLEAWKIFNCSECEALNNAFNGGAKAENIQVHTVKINKGAGTFEDFNTCANCKVTTKGMEVTSDK
jgi:hypothetical protein